MKESMNRSKIIAALTTVSLVAAAVSVAPTATAVQFYGAQKNDRSICVSQSTPNEVQVTRDYYQAQLDEYLVMQNELRQDYPQFEQYYADFDRLIAQGLPVTNSAYYPGINAIIGAGFNLFEARFFAVRATDTYEGLQELATSGFSMDLEFAPGWTQAQMENYPSSGTPVVPIGADWTMGQTSAQSVEAYRELTAGLPIGPFRVSQTSIPNLYSYVTPRLEALAPAKVRYDAVMSPTAVLWAAQSCLTLYQAGDLPATGPVTTTTVTPTATATAEPTTTTVTPSPTTTTVAPVTSTVTAPVLTTTVTAPVVTVSETPAPVTTTVAGATTTVTEGPVTTTVQLPTETVTEVAPTVTVTVTPTATATDTPDPGDGGNNFGMVAAIVAVLAVIGGIAAFFANNLGLFAGFF